jgi:hypothetical protein
MTAEVKKKPSRLKAIKPELTLPSKPKMLLFGKPSVGKTWTSLDFPKCYYIDTERGATRKHYMSKLQKSGGAYMGPDEGSLDFPTVIEQVKALATEDHDFKTLIIDSFSKLYNTFAADAAETGGDDFGRDKKEANKPTRKLISWLDRIDMNVILIAHEKDKWGVDAKGQRTVVGATFDAYEKMEYELDLALNIIKTGPNRVARITKSRLAEFPESESLQWSYKEFASRYGEEIIEKKTEQIVLATSHQVQQIIDLLDLVKLKEGTVEKWFKAAGVEGWEDMATAEIAKAIKHIEGLVNRAKGEAL